NSVALRWGLVEAAQPTVDNSEDNRHAQRALMAWSSSGSRTDLDFDWSPDCLVLEEIVRNPKRTCAPTGIATVRRMADCFGWQRTGKRVFGSRPRRVRRCGPALELSAERSLSVAPWRAPPWRYFHSVHSIMGNLRARFSQHRDWHQDQF